MQPLLLGAVELGQGVALTASRAEGRASPPVPASARALHPPALHRVRALHLLFYPCPGVSSRAVLRQPTGERAQHRLYYVCTRKCFLGSWSFGLHCFLHTHLRAGAAPGWRCGVGGKLCARECREDVLGRPLFRDISRNLHPSPLSGAAVSPPCPALEATGQAPRHQYSCPGQYLSTRDW